MSFLQLHPPLSSGSNPVAGSNPSSGSNPYTMTTSFGAGATGVPFNFPLTLAYNNPFSNHPPIFRPVAQTPEKPFYPGTNVPYKPSFQDDEKATFHSICAMDAYAHKSPEELRMEDYKQRAISDTGVCVTRQSSKSSSAVIPSSQEVADEPMDFEYRMNATEKAGFLAHRFVEIVSEKLSQEEWRLVRGFVGFDSSALEKQLIRLLLRWEELKADTDNEAPPDFTVGYHFTTLATLDPVRQHGLRTQQERFAMGLCDNFYAAALGDGCYTGNAPTDFYNFRPGATAGFMVLRIVCEVDTFTGGTLDDDADTIWGLSRNYKNILNIRRSDQCAILVEYNGRTVFKDPYAKAQLLRLQTFFEEVVDFVLMRQHNSKRSASTSNQPKKSVLVKTLASLHDLERKKIQNSPSFVMTYVAPQSLISCDEFDDSVADADPNSIDSDKECSICMDVLRGEGVALQKLKCGHVFHKECMNAIVRSSTTCPLCRFSFREPLGTSPSGTMTVRFDPVIACYGYGPGTIVIKYNMSFGVQKSYHENRGSCFQKSSRTAYIPDTEDGRELLRRLVYAFLRGLIFTVGTSLTTQKANSIIWASIHHKTNLFGGVRRHGFPDDDYFSNANCELDAVGVPKAGESGLNLPEAKEVLEYLEASKVL